MLRMITAITGLGGLSHLLLSAMYASQRWEESP